MKNKYCISSSLVLNEATIFKKFLKMLAFLAKNGYNIDMNIRDNREWEQIPLSNFWKNKIKGGKSGKYRRKS